MRHLPIAFLFLLLSTPAAHALSITWTSFSPTTISNETNLPNGTTITFSIDQPGDVRIDVSRVLNFGDPGTQVATLNKTIAGPCPCNNQTIFWDALWLIDGEMGRRNGIYSFTLTLSTTSGTATVTPPSVVTLNSVDIHSILVTPSADTNGLPTFPYLVSYALAKQASVTTTITDSSGTVVRSLLPNKLQSGETTVSTCTLTWNGLGDDAKPVSIGLYTLTMDATDPASGDRAITRTRSIAVESLAGSAADPQKLFEDNVYVFPNPVRNGVGTFHVLPVRDNATIHLRIYTISGDLVLDKDITGQVFYPWKVINQSGNKVGRGLYYYVMREDDPQGTLQTVKKMAVIP